MNAGAAMVNELRRPTRVGDSRAQTWQIMACLH